MNMVCHPAARGEEEEATLDLICTVRRGALVGSQITIATVVVVGGVSSVLWGGWLVWQVLFQLQGDGGRCSLS